MTDTGSKAQAEMRSEDRPYCCGKPMQPDRECPDCGCTLSDEWNAALGGKLVSR